MKNRKDKTQATDTEIVFLDGPRSRWKEFLFVNKVLFQFIRGFRKLHFAGPCVTVFGSARFEEGHPYYMLARKMGYEISKLGFAVMTGGGPGIMEAANRGAKDAGGKSIGCNIKLPLEQTHNPYLDKWVTIDLFFVRKVLLNKYSYAFIVMPGGFGTLDEFFETLTLVQTGKSKPFPIILMGLDYHKGIIDHINQMKAEKTISEKDLDLILITDSVDEAIEHLRKHAIGRFKLKPRKKFRPIWFLGE